MVDLFNKKSAIISDCGAYRYRLNRRWFAENRFGVLFIMLNPSTADADIDDPTVRRCTGFTRSWGYGGFGVVNLFAYRATDPSELMVAADPVGPQNDAHIQDALAHCDFVVCAWGANKVADRRAGEVLRLIRDWNKIPHCLDITKSGAPKHPLYVKGSATPSVYSSPNRTENGDDK